MGRAVLAIVGLLLLSACSPANERPLRGAQPGTAPPPPTAPGVPPTLTASEALRQRALPSPSPAVAEPQPSPAVNPSAAPSPSVVSQPPIVRTIAPAANGHVPPGGPVTLSAVLVGRTADLASASLSVNGADASAQIDKRSPRDWTIHASQTLANGTHTVRVLVRDASGAAGGFTWQFAVGEQEPTPTPMP
ncbi:MAG: hypothetical protein JO020_27435 [Chloroflexi bacterium]|nr:hypothetical protein [Chloroflexota bacterium]